MKLRRNLLFCFYLLAGVVLGALLANLCSGIQFLQWLCYESNIGFGPVTIDLSIVNFTVGAHMGINVAQIFTVGIALWLYYRVAGKG